jgi:hypothetical protein
MITAVSTVHSGKGTKTRCESVKAKTAAIVRPVFLNFRAERFPWDRGVAHCKLQRQGLRDRAADVAGGEAGPQDQPNRWPSLRQGRICLPSVER